MITKSMGKFQAERVDFNTIFLGEKGTLLHYRYKDKHIRLKKVDNTYKWTANLFISGLRPFKTFDEAYLFMSERLKEQDLLCI